MSVSLFDGAADWMKRFLASHLNWRGNGAPTRQRAEASVHRPVWRARLRRGQARHRHQRSGTNVNGSSFARRSYSARMRHVTNALRRIPSACAIVPRSDSLIAGVFAELDTDEVLDRPIRREHRLRQVRSGRLEIDRRTPHCARGPCRSTTSELQMVAPRAGALGQRLLLTSAPSTRRTERKLARRIRGERGGSNSMSSVDLAHLRQWIGKQHGIDRDVLSSRHARLMAATLGLPQTGR